MRVRLSQYEEQGYRVIPQVLSPHEVTAAAAEIERLHQRAADDPDGGHFQVKPARHGSRHALHHDVAYWPLE